VAINGDANESGTVGPWERRQKIAGGERSHQQCWIKQSVTGRYFPRYAFIEHGCSYGPFLIGALCPLVSMAPGRRLNIGEAFIALP
jgi:hypothetical protein